MPEKFESGETQEDVADVMSTLIREFAENRDSKVAQMTKVAKDLWMKGEHAAAYWILEAHNMGEDNAMASINRFENAGNVSRAVTEDLCNDESLRSKFGKVTQKMSTELHGE